MQEENIVDELNRQGLTHARSESVQDAASHEGGVGRALTAADQTKGEAEHGKEHDWSTAEYLSTILSASRSIERYYLEFTSARPPLAGMRQVDAKEYAEETQTKSLPWTSEMIVGNALDTAV